MFRIFIYEGSWAFKYEIKAESFLILVRYRKFLYQIYKPNSIRCSNESCIVCTRANSSTLSSFRDSSVVVGVGFGKRSV